MIDAKKALEMASKILRRRAAGYDARHTAIFNGRIMADELKANAREIEAIADYLPDHVGSPKERMSEETATGMALRAIRNEIIEQCAKVAEGTAPIAAGNFFAARRDQCAKIAAKIRALSITSGVREGK